MTNKTSRIGRVSPTLVFRGSYAQQPMKQNMATRLGVRTSRDCEAFSLVSLLSSTHSATVCCPALFTCFSSNRQRLGSFMSLWEIPKRPNLRP